MVDRDFDLIGRRIAFPPRLSDRNRLALVGDDAAIRQSLYLIIFTVPGERVMRPNFGCRIHELIFDPANEETATQAEIYVREAIHMWEPRIIVNEVNIEIGDTERGEMFIHIAYTHKDIYDRRSLVYPFYLNPQE